MTEQKSNTVGSDFWGGSGRSRGACNFGGFFTFFFFSYHNLNYCENIVHLNILMK